MYLVGEGSSATLAYDLGTATWTSGLAARPFVGHHHVAEVVGGKLYLIGGLHGGSEGKVQVYNPATNSWSTGASMPFAAGSSSSAVIDGEIYVAGGIIGSATTNQVAKYNPQTNAWTVLASMPQGVNHAASISDGTKLWVFGGRDGGNVPANGFDYVQVYNPATNTWQSSASGAAIAPLPQARGGMGKAVYRNGEFYVMGGETSTGAGATANKVYNRVDIYNPLTNTWRLGSPMPTARHGIFPLLHAGRIYVAGGGTQAGFSASALLEVYEPV
jgi:N-acetylneuraminic acid mutarotase